MSKSSGQNPGAAIDLAHEPDFEIAAMTVRPSACEVEIAGVVQKVDPRSMQVLVALAQAKGAVVSRDDLLQTCWGGVIVGDDAINRAVFRVRRLSELGRSPAFKLETIPKIGYRLIPSAVQGSDAPPLQAAPAPVRSFFNLRTAAIAAGALVVSAFGATALIGGFDRGERTLAVEATPYVAVLPFDNLSGNPEFAYFSDGVSVDIQATLARLPREIRVAGTATGFQFRGDKKKPANVRREIGATHIIDGSVRRDGDKLRVTAQFVDTKDGAVLWAETYDRSIEHVLDIQGNIAERTAAVFNAAAPEIAAAEPVPREAVEYYLRGVLLRKDTISSRARAAEAVRLFEGATRAAPRFARAWVRLADAYRVQAWKQPEEMQIPIVAKARAAAMKALELDPQQGFAHATLNRLEPRWSWHARAKHLERALVASPNDVEVLRFYMDFLVGLGRRQDVRRVVDRIQGLEPTPGESNVHTVAKMLKGDPLAEEEKLRRLVLQHPKHAMTWIGYFVNRMDAWDLPAARRAGAEVKRNLPALQEIFGWTPAQAEGTAKWVDDNIKAMEEWPPSEAEWAAATKEHLEKLSVTTRGQECALDILRDFAETRANRGYGRTDLAWDILDELYLRRGFVGTLDSHCTKALVFPERQTPTGALFEQSLATLRRDPRIWTIFRAVGLAQYWRETNVWPDFCEEQDLPYDCRKQADAVLGGATPIRAN